MSENAPKALGRTLLGGKIIFNFGQSTVDCTVRQLSDAGATVGLESGIGIPDSFQLSLPTKCLLLPCKVAWRSEKQIGVTFSEHQTEASSVSEALTQRGPEHTLRTQMLALNAALDQMPLGIVLLDSRLTARFINRAFRKMWALPDTVADHHPSFAALMFHGRDTGAYEVASDRLDEYVAERIERITKNESFQIDLRRSSGDVLRMQCTPLPDGGRMVSYMEVTDIVRQADELRVLRDALDNVQDGVLLLDADLNATFMNGKVRTFWEISDKEAAAKPAYAALITRARRAIEPKLPSKELSKFATARVAEVRAGDHVRELHTPDDRRLRAHCTNMAGGGRMITYYDVSDLVRNAEQLERLASTDPLTGLYNRRHFLEAVEAEWSRFQRYYRSMAILMIDIDYFKSVNDRYGHAVGDEAIRAVANACLHRKRKSDVVGRVGGEEFAMLLPETATSQAKAVAERIRKQIASQKLKAHEACFSITASIGVAEAFVGMSGVEALMIAADQALYRAKAEGRDRCVSWAPTEANDICNTATSLRQQSRPLKARRVYE